MSTPRWRSPLVCLPNSYAGSAYIRVWMPPPIGPASQSVFQDTTETLDLLRSETLRIVSDTLRPRMWKFRVITQQKTEVTHRPRVGGNGVIPVGRILCADAGKKEVDALVDLGEK